MSTEQENSLQFSPLSSFIHPSFWHKFSEIKINVDGLDEKPKKIWGYFGLTPQFTVPFLEVDSASFNTTLDCPKGYLSFHGKILNLNTIEQFQKWDKTALISQCGQEFWEMLENGVILKDPSRLNQFILLAFSDLRSYQFYYWFAFPVPYSLHLLKSQPERLFSEEFSQKQLITFNEKYTSLDVIQKTFFLISKECQIDTLSNGLRLITEDNYTGFYFGFTDYFVENSRSQLKNYIVAILFYCPFLTEKSIKIVRFYPTKKLEEISEFSRIQCIKLPTLLTSCVKTDLCNQWVGWEKNDKQKLGPRLANMRGSMDPKILMEDSSDLNLKLMKWRMLPDFDLNRIKSTKFLLLGAGTLGCTVARTLLGWGAKHLTFLDYGQVSYSNPARQILYTYEDALERRSKVEAACASLKKIQPGINCSGCHLTIPMPSHPIDSKSLDSVRNSVETLEKLIQENDVIFLLTDSRESRWLPTVLGAFHRKIVVNCALGFDSFLVMRHGYFSSGSKPLTQNDEIAGKSSAGYFPIAGENLGCYFCSNVTAPGNSTLDRTLDQQCTVTRPGLAYIAGALSAELAIALVQHPKKCDAPALCQNSAKDDLPDNDENAGILGIIPHSIRGFLPTFQQITPAFQKYAQCVACSQMVLEEFSRKRFQFLLEVFDNGGVLEELTGLNQLLDNANFNEILEFSDDGSM